MKSMALKKQMMSADEGIAIGEGFSNKGIGKKEDEKEECYPYCLRLYLGKDEIEMLGIDELPELGSKMQMQAMVKVIGLRDSNDGKSIDLQIVAMDLNQEKAKKPVQEMLYDDKD